jgi:hypothetical protein
MGLPYDLSPDRNDRCLFPFGEFGAVNPPALHVRQHLLDSDADTAANTVLANQIVANPTIPTSVGRIAERLEAHHELAMLAFEAIATNRS